MPIVSIYILRSHTKSMTALIAQNKFVIYFFQVQYIGKCLTMKRFHHIIIEGMHQKSGWSMSGNM